MYIILKYFKIFKIIISFCQDFPSSSYSSSMMNKKKRVLHVYYFEIFLKIIISFLEDTSPLNNNNFGKSLLSDYLFSQIIDVTPQASTLIQTARMIAACSSKGIFAGFTAFRFSKSEHLKI